MSVSILDDNVIETTESFYVTLARSPDLDGRIRLTPVYGVIEIDDDDGLLINAMSACKVHVTFSFFSQLLRYVWRGDSTRSMRMLVQ